MNELHGPAQPVHGSEAPKTGKRPSRFPPSRTKQVSRSRPPPPARSKNTRKCRCRFRACVEFTATNIIFYGIVGGFFGGIYLVYHRSFNPSRMVHVSSYLIGRPGLSYFPVSPHLDSIAIWYNRSDNKRVKTYTQQLLAIVNREHERTVVDGTQIEYVTCDYTVKYVEDNRHPAQRLQLKPNQVCRVYDTRLDWGPCTPYGRPIRPSDPRPFRLGDDAFGFKSGQPCVMIRLNRIVNWRPSQTGLSREGRRKYSSGSTRRIWAKYESIVVNHPDANSTIWILCDGSTEEDRELMGTIEYYPNPRPGIPKIYFPFSNEDGYLPPFIFLRFLNLMPDVLIEIECIAYDNNIEYKEDIGSGTVTFEMLLDDNED